MRVVVERAEKRGEGNHELCGSERICSLTAIESILMHPTKGAHEPHMYFNNMLLRSAVTLVVGILEYECLVIRIRRASAAPLWGAMMKDGG